MKNYLADFGANVKKYRKDLKISQEELAFAIGRDARSIVAIEGGNRNPTLHTIKKLCEALKVKSSDLLSF